MSTKVEENKDNGDYQKSYALQFVMDWMDSRKPKENCVYCGKPVDPRSRVGGATWHLECLIHQMVIEYIRLRLR